MSPGPDRPSDASPGTGHDADLAPASLAQQRLWFLSRLEPGSAAYNVPRALRLRGPLQPAALERALRAVVQRHEALRTTFALLDDELVQVIAPEAAVALPTIDLRMLAPDQREAEWRRLAADEGARPFDLAQGPLLRAVLLRLDAASHVLLLTVHHIVSDGWSQEVLLRELAECYAADVAGRAPVLPELPIQYADFAAWQRERSGADAEGQLVGHWAQQLAGVPLVLELPTDFARPSVQSDRGGLVTLAVPTAVWAAVAAYGRAEGVTPFMTLLAAWQAVLSRWSGQERFVVGTVSAGRERPELEHVVGFFVNTLPIPADLRGAPTFRALTAAARDALGAAFRHEGLPFDRLVDALQPSRTRDRHPIYQVMFSQEPAGTPQWAGDVEMLPELVHNQSAKCDLLLTVAAAPEGPTLYAEFSEDLFAPATVKDWLQRFLRLLAAAVESPATPVTRLPLLDVGEAQRLRGWSQGEAPDYPRASTVHREFEAQAARTPDAPAVVAGAERLTYAELNARANRLAAVLREDGVTPGAFVAVALDRTPDLVVAQLAVLKAGAAYAPLDPAYPSDRLAFMLDDTAAAVVITSRPQAPQLPRGRARVLCLEDLASRLAAAPAANPLPLGGPAHPAYVMYTSGSSGQPKGVVVPHRAILRLVVATTYVRWPEVSAMLQMAPSSFDASTFEVWGALLHGARLVQVPGRHVGLDALERTLKGGGVDTAWLTAALFNAVVDERPSALGGLRQLLIGGEALSVDHVARAQAALPRTAVVNGYGPTECTTFACCHAIPRPLPPGTRSIPIGRPIAQTQAWVVDAHGALAAPGTPGELWLGGDGLALGYLNQPALTAERFVADPFEWAAGRTLYRTGDRVRWLADGTLEFLGRLDRQVKLRGFRVEPGEVEGALRALGCRDAVVDVEGTGTEARLVAYVVPGPDAPAGADLRQALRERLPEHMVPGAITRLAALPRTANGKLDRAALPAHAAPVAAAAEPAEATALERQLADTWSEVLGRHVGPDDDFFDIGGHSLLAIRLFSRIEERFGVALPLGALFERPTVRRLAPLLVPREAGDEAALVALQPLGDEKPIFFAHGVVGEVWSFRHLARFFAPSRPVYGLQVASREATGATTIEETAARYVAEIQRRFPQGPYHLGGFCSGAVIAFEMAQQLRASGAQVGLLAVIEQGFAEVQPRSALGAASDMLRNLPYWVLDDALTVGPSALLARVGTKLRMATATSDDRPETRLRDALGMWEVPDSHAQVLLRQYEALMAYVPRPYAGAVHLFRSRADRLLAPRREHDLGWGRFAASVEVLELPGSHETMLHERYAGGLATSLRDALARVEHGGRGGRPGPA